MPQRGPIWIADVLRVFRDLEPSEAVAEQVLRSLGIDRAPLVQPARVSGAFEHSTMAPRPSGGFAASELPAGRIEGAGAVTEAAADGAIYGPTTVAPLGTAETTDQPPAWFTATMPLERAMVRAVPASLPPLFLPAHARGILGAGLATRESDGGIDVAQLIACLARLEVVVDLPRLAEPSLRRGVQVLEDHAAAMAPYAEDRGQLLAEIVRAVGRFRVSTVRFKGLPPTRLPASLVRGRFRWSPPPRGTPVVIISDLGIGGASTDPDRALPSDWVGFATEAREYGCPVVAFVPFGPRRWHPLVARAMTLIHWDRRTSAGMVRRAVGLGHRIPS